MSKDTVLSNQNTPFYDNYTHIIWDFNGTLLDDVEAAIRANNVMLTRRSLPRIGSVEEYHSLAETKITDYYRRIGFDLEVESFPSIAAEWTQEYLTASADCVLAAGARAALDYFRTLSLPQLVLSATEVNMLRFQLDRLGITEYFSEIIGLDNFHTVDKTAVALSWAQRNTGARPLVIGDSELDAKGAQEIHADCILTEGGHRGRALLETCGTRVLENLLYLI